MSSLRNVCDFPRNEPGLVDKFIGSAFDVVFSVSQQLELLAQLPAIAATIPNAANIATTKLFPDAQSGMVATTYGQYFFVAGAANSDILATLYQNDNGVATPLNSYPSASGAWDRANHTGVQAISTITGLQQALDGMVLTSDIQKPTSANMLNYMASGGYAIRNILQHIEDFVSVHDYGAFGDGSNHPLYSVNEFNGLDTSKYVLTDWQAIFPNATAMTQEVDYLAHDLALKNNDKVFVPAGTYRFGSDTLTLPSRDGIRVLGAGRNSTFWVTDSATADVICFATTAQSGQEVSNGNIYSSVQKTAGAAIKMTGGHSHMSRCMTFGSNLYISYELLNWNTQFNYFIDHFEINSGAYGFVLGDGSGTTNWLQNIWIHNGLIYNITKAGFLYSNISGFYVDNVDVGSGDGMGHQFAPSSGQVVTAGQLSRTGGDTMGGAGFYCYQPGGTVSNIRITNAWVSNCGKIANSGGSYNPGVFFDGTNSSGNFVCNITFDSPLVFRNSDIGMSIVSVKNFTIMNPQVHDNGLVTLAGHGIYVNSDSCCIVGGAVGPTPSWASNTQDYGIFLDSNAINFYIAGVNLESNNVAGMAVAATAKGTISGCLNWVTKSTGSVKIPSGSTSLVVTTNIGPAVKQTSVFLQLISSIQGATQVWVSSVSGNTFTISLDAALTADAYVNWFIDQELLV